jgi:GxxExxY protein
MTDEELTYAMIGQAYRVYNELGYGFLESGYIGALSSACRKMGLRVERERCIPLYFDGEIVANYRVDLLIDDRLIVEGKTRQSLLPEDIKQLWNYLRCSDIELALLINFGPSGVNWRRYWMPNRNKHNCRLRKAL